MSLLFSDDSGSDTYSTEAPYYVQIDNENRDCLVVSASKIK